MRILITGANGFVGRKLCKTLSQAGHHITAMTYKEYSSPVQADEHVQCDIRDASALEAAVKIISPSHVIHLAALTHIPTSFENVQLTWQVNAMGSLHLFEALRRNAPNAFTLFVSSSEVYGASFKQGLPLSEGAYCAPLNPYAASKLAAETAFLSALRRGLRGIIARPFNHIGPGQSTDFVASSFAQQIALIEGGKQPPIIKVGNLEAYRDFLDVEDVCQAYAKLLLVNERDDLPPCINICSGRPRKIEEILEMLLSLSPTIITIQPEPSRMRPSEIPYAAGNNERLRTMTGWRATRDLPSTLSSLLEYWRAEAALQ